MKTNIMKPGMKTKQKAADIPGLFLLEGDGRPVIAVFGATWCGVCKNAVPEIEKGVEKAGAEKFKVVKIDVDEYPALSGALKIGSVPTTIGFHGGQPSYGVVGRMPPRNLKLFLQKVEKFHNDNAAKAAAAPLLAASRRIRVYKPLKLKQGV